METQGPALREIRVLVTVGRDLMAGTDDPLFLRLGGPAGREFRLAPPSGRSLRRGGEDVFVLGGAEPNVAHPELNDPGAARIPLASVSGVWLRKGLAPLPNVRGVGELDDRLQIEQVAVTLAADDGPTRHFERKGPQWLGLVCGLEMALAESGGAVS